MSEAKHKLIDRLVLASRSFRKGIGRHILKTQDVVYCSFSTPAIRVEEEESQRSAKKRIKKFDLIPDEYIDSDVLDLGSHCGAMLFEFQQLGIRRGVGVEFDQEKVDLANEIANISCFENLTFMQGDVDALRGADVGDFDIVLALAIEGHVKNRSRLFDLLATVTKSIIIFEGNGNCDTLSVSEQMEKRGFALHKDLGFCDDDIRPENNKRPVLVFKRHVERFS